MQSIEMQIQHMISAGRVTPVQVFDKMIELIEDERSKKNACHNCRKPDKATARAVYMIGQLRSEIKNEIRNLTDRAIAEKFEVSYHVIERFSAGNTESAEAQLEQEDLPLIAGLIAERARLRQEFDALSHDKLAERFGIKKGVVDRIIYSGCHCGDMTEVAQ